MLRDTDAVLGITKGPILTGDGFMAHLDARISRRKRLGDWVLHPGQVRDIILIPLQEAQADRVPSRTSVLRKFFLYSEVSDNAGWQQNPNQFETLLDFISNRRFVAEAERVELGAAIVDRELSVPEFLTSSDLDYIKETNNNISEETTLSPACRWLMVVTRIPRLQNLVSNGEINKSEAVDMLTLFEDAYLGKFIGSSRASRVYSRRVLSITRDMPVSNSAGELVQKMATNPEALFSQPTP